MITFFTRRLRPAPARRRTRQVDAEVDMTTPGPPRLVSVQETGGWLSASEEREYRVFSEIDDLLVVLSEEGYKNRANHIRKQLQWLRYQAALRDLPWGAGRGYRSVH